MLAHIFTAIVLAIATHAGSTPPAPTQTPTPTPKPPVATPKPTLTPEPTTYAPILMYHKIGYGLGRYGVTVEQFAAQMKWLKENGYETVSVDQMAAAIRGQGALPPKPIAITFDDGWRTQFTLAKPILDQYGFKATFYIVTNYAGRTPTFMSWEDIAALSAQGHWIGSHSLSHTSSTRLSAAQLTQEMTASRDILAQHTGKPITSYAYPYGATNKFAQEMAQQLGYDHAVGVVSSWQQKPSELYNLHRIEVSGFYGLSAVVGWITGHPMRVYVPPPVMPGPPLAHPEPALP